MIPMADLRRYCTFGIGGPARYLLEVRTVAELSAALLEARRLAVPYFVLGKGSNCLFDDKGFDGMVILNKIESFANPEPGLYHAGAGFSFSLLGTQTARKGWSGLEFAAGIPGSVGGAVYMNAGANGKETCQSLHSVEFVHPDGSLQVFKHEDLTFSYRHSPFQHMQGAIASASFQLEAAPTARSKQMAIINYRTETQPLKEKSAGCIFRNPGAAPAGALIEACGLKGVHIGGAKVSEVHANFIVNTGNAAATDVLQLIEKIKEKVKNAKNIDLECEVKVIPFDASRL